MSDVYSSQRLDIRRPPMIVSIMDIVGGAVFVLMAVIVAIRTAGQIYRIEYLLREVGETPDALVFIASELVVVIMALVALIRGLKLVIHGLTEVISPWRPSNIPTNFFNYNNVYNAFRQRILSCYVQSAGPMRTIFGPNTMFLSPVQRSVVTVNAQAISRQITGAVFSAILLAGSAVAANQFGTRPVIGVFVLAILLFSILAIADYVLCFMIVPRAQPNTVAAEATEYFKGFGHPAQLISRLNDAAIPLRWNNFQNRFTTNWNENSSASVNDVGQFVGTAFIEQQPQPIEDQFSKSANIMLFLGWGLSLVGYASLLFFLNNVMGQTMIAALFSIVGLLMFGLAASSNGTRMVNMARYMLESTRFRSPAILMEFAGHLAKAEVKLGSSMIDSIQSNNVSVRSDFTVRFWSAEVISESARLDAPREILALNQTTEAGQWINFFKEAITKLREERVRPVGVEIQSQEAQEIVQANIAISGMRVGAEQRAAAQVAAGEPVKVPPSLPSATISEIQYCPACGTLRVPGSKFCHSCGNKLE